MKNYDFFPGAGKFYKANLHCHTVISDGKLTKEQIRKEYQKRVSEKSIRKEVIPSWRSQTTGPMAIIRN